MIPALVVWLLAGIGLNQPGFAHKETRNIEDETKILTQYRTANVPFEEGKLYFQRGKMKRALGRFKESTSIMPQHADGHYFLAHIFYKQKNYQEARFHIEKAIVHFELFSQCYLKNHQLYLQQLGEQKVKIQEQIELDRYNIPLTPSCIMRGKMSAEITKKEDEVSLIGTRLSRPLPDLIPKLGEYHYLYGNILYQSEKFGQAAVHYHQAIRINPRHKNAYHNLAGLYYRAGVYQKSREILDIAQSNGIDLSQELKQSILDGREKDR